MTGALFNDWQTGAQFDSTRKYRYSLWRRWNPNAKMAAFVMLNPSTADENIVDPTVLKCCQWVRAWGYGGLWVVNAFALRATDPAALRVAARAGQDPIGLENDEFIRQIAQECDERESLIVVGWGRHATLLNRNQQMRNLLADFHLPALGINKDGSPEHPLYLRKVSKPIPWPQ